MPAVAISGPFGAVKEQSSGLYAQTIAENGFVILAFDPSYTGKSEGESRHVTSSDVNLEGFNRAVDFLSNHPNVDSERIGILTSNVLFFDEFFILIWNTGYIF